MIDRTTKILLLAIAMGLWVNLFSAWVHPVSVQAAQAPGQALAFLDYAELVQQQRKQGVAVEDIQVLLLTHIAGNTRR